MKKENGEDHITQLQQGQIDFSETSFLSVSQSTSFYRLR